MAHDFGRWYDIAFDDVIGHVQHAGQEDLVARYAFGLIGFAVAHCWWIFEDKTTFGADWYDDGIFDLLCFDQTKNLGAEIFTTIRPTQTTAGDFTAA